MPRSGRGVVPVSGRRATTPEGRQRVGVGCVGFEDEAKSPRSLPQARERPRPRGHDRQGGPDRVRRPEGLLDPGAEVQRAAQIGPGASIEGDAIVAEHAVIGVNVEVWDAVVIGRRRRDRSLCERRRRRASRTARACARDQDRRRRGLPRVDARTCVAWVSPPERREPQADETDARRGPGASPCPRPQRSSSPASSSSVCSRPGAASVGSES